MYLSCEYCVLSDRGLCDRPIPRPEDSCRVCVCVWGGVSESDVEGIGRRSEINKERLQQLTNFQY